MSHQVETQRNYSLQGSISVASIPLSAFNWSIDGQTFEEQEEKQHFNQRFEGEEEVLPLEEEQWNQMNEDTTGWKSTGKRSSLKDWYNWFTTSQLWAHLLMLGSQLVFAGFCILVPVALEVVNPIVFSCIRIGIMCMTMFPLSLTYDRGFIFQKQSSVDDRANGDSQMLDSEQNQISKLTWKNYLLAKIPGRPDALIMAFCGIMLFMSIAFYTAAIAFISTTIAGVLSPLGAVFTCLISVALKRENKALLKFAGVLIAVIGSITMLVITSIMDGKNDATEGNNNFLGIHFSIKSLLGVIFMLCNTVAWAIYLIVQKTILDRGIPPFTQSSWSMLSSFIVSCVASLFFIKDFHPTQLSADVWIGIIYAALVHGTINYTLNAFAAKLMTPTMISVYGCAAPMVSAISLYVFLGKTTTWFASIGAILITVGVFMVAYAKKRETQQKLNAEQQLTNMQVIEEQELANVQVIEEQELVNSSTSEIETTDRKSVV